MSPDPDRPAPECGCGLWLCCECRPENFPLSDPAAKVAMSLRSLADALARTEEDPDGR